MKVVFLKDVPGKGRKGDVKEINDGFARNFLIPKSLAVIATASIVNKLENEGRQRAEKEKKLLEQHQKIKADLDKRIFSIYVKTGDKNQIYGSVHEKDVQAVIKEKTKYSFEKNQIILPKHIKELGEYRIDVRLSGNIVAHPKIKLINK